MKDDKRLKRKVRNSYIVSTVSMGLVLFLLGSVGYLMIAAMQVADSLRERIPVSVELSREVSPERQEAIARQLSDSELVGSLEFVSKDEKAEDAEFRKLFGSQFEEVLAENPLLDSFELTLTARSEERRAVEEFLDAARRIEGVEYVSDPAQLAERVHTTVQEIRLVLLLFGGALLVISLILLSNTIRLAIFSKRYLINTMKLVGATKWFIMRPFLGSSIVQGLLAGTGASALFIGAICGLNEAAPELATLSEAAKTAAILGAMIAGGILLSLIFTYIALNKFVNMKSNKIYLY